MRRAILLSAAAHLLMATAVLLFARAGPAVPVLAADLTAEMIFTDPGGDGQPASTAPRPDAPAAAPEPEAAAPAKAAAEPAPAPPSARAEPGPVRLTEQDADSPGQTDQLHSDDDLLSPDPSAPNIAPRYPREAARLGQAGAVTLAVEVAPDGMAEAVSVYRSSGFATLDDAARAAVARWRFRPKGGAAVPAGARTLIRISFQLD